VCATPVGRGGAGCLRAPGRLSSQAPGTPRRCCGWTGTEPTEGDVR
jgi:hypothetical protein